MTTQPKKLLWSGPEYDNQREKSMSDEDPKFQPPQPQESQTGFPPAPPPQPVYVQGYPQQFIQKTRTSGLAIASLVLGIVWLYWVGSVLAVIFAGVALSQMKKDESLGGKGMAIAGLVLGIIGVVILVIVLIAAASVDSSYNYDSSY